MIGHRHKVLCNPIDRICNNMPGGALIGFANADLQIYAQSGSPNFNGVMLHDAALCPLAGP